MKALLPLLLPLFLTAQTTIERIGTIPGCICTDLVIESRQSIVVTCKDGYVIRWTPTSRDTLLAIPHLVETEGELGLLGLAYLDTTLVINYTDLGYDQRLVSVDGLTFDTLFSVFAQTNFPTHRGGDLCIWNGEIVISIGEGPGGDGYLLSVPSMDTLATGLRNPWRIAPGPPFYITDVGDIDYEEINILEVGAHYGWPCFEGTATIGPDTCGSVIFPWLQYPRNGGTAIIGGYQGPSGFVFADHYKPHLYVTDGTVIDTFPGHRYLTAIDGDMTGGMAVGWDGRIYEITHQTTGVIVPAGSTPAEIVYFDLLGRKFTTLEGVPAGFYFDNQRHKYVVTTPH